MSAIQPEGSDSPRSSSAYRREDGHVLIEIRLREVRQLFHTLDPAPFREKDLDSGAEQYLLDACREAGPRQNLLLIIYLPATEVSSEAAKTLPVAIHNYFAYRSRQKRADMIHLVQRGIISLLIGSAFLTACLGLRGVLLSSPWIIDRAWVGEGLLIGGWVAMWRPLEILLYDWWPLVRQQMLLRRLARISIEIRAST
jgi:hypothetical protein